MNNKNYKVINRKDEITLEPTALYDALIFAELIYDGSGIEVEIVNPLGVVVNYAINYQGKAILI